MIATGVFLACTLGCKMVGLLTFLTIGSAVLVDLWNLLDHRKGLTMVRSITSSLAVCRRLLCALQDQVTKHFFARAFGLILVPLIVYLSFFWVHFKILKFSGTGDTFMSPAFQETLYGNELLTSSHGERRRPFLSQSESLSRSAI